MKRKHRYASLAPILFWVLAPLPLSAVINVNDGATYTINSPQTASDDFDLDHQATVGGGTLAITSSGSLTFSTARTISNTFGEGEVELDGDLVQNAAAPTTIFARVSADTGSILRATQSNLYLSGGGSYQGNLDANGGDIYFASGSHILDGATITGTGSLYAFGSSISILSSVNPSAGAASGGLVVQGGTITSLGALLGGLGSDTLSVARANFGNGTINGAKIRITATGSISHFSTMDLNRGSVINEGIFTHNHGGKFNVDLDTTSGGGALVNHATWRLLGFSDVNNTGGEGEFINHGVVLQDDPLGFSIISAKFNNKSGAVLQSTSGSLIQLKGGGIYEYGSELNAIGDISMLKGTHFLSDVILSGSGALRVDSAESNVILMGNVGPLSGSASGGLILSGGKISNLGALGSGGYMAVQRGEFQSGTISGAHLRITGAAEKTAGSTTNIDFGSLTIEDTMVQRNGGSFLLDSIDTEDIFGTIVNKGTWTMEGNSGIRSLHGEGEFINHATIRKSGALTISTCAAKFINQSNAIIQADADATLILDGGGSYGSNTSFNAEGTIAFGNGLHTVMNSQLTGSGYLRTLGSGANLTLFGNIGPATGPATGGFHLGGGTIANFSALFGGAGTGVISAERGKLASGTIDGATLRFTGNSEKTSNSEIHIRSGKLMNEGVLIQAADGDFEIDPDSDDSIHGTIENRGTWSMTGSSTIQSYYGGGSFVNHGLLQVEENVSIGSIAATIANHETGVIRVHSGSYLHLLGTTSHHTGSVLDADGGAISFGLGTHLLNGCQITGNNAVRCSSTNFHIISRVGPETGPATGGFSLEGGVLRGEFNPGFGILITGPGQGNIAVDHGQIQYGRIEKAHLRYTGTASKTNSLFSFVIADGSLTNDGTFTQSANGNIELHAASPPNDGGTLVNNGTWQSQGTSEIKSTLGAGIFRNAGLLTHAAGTLTLATPYENQMGGSLSTTGGTIILSRNSTHQSGSILNANNGTISLQTQTHSFYGGTFQGTSFVELPSGTLHLFGNVGANTGPATGKFLLNGGTLDGATQLSVSDASIQHGLITGSPTLRLTGTSSKSASNILSMNGGTIRNEGVFSMAANAQINLDSAAAGGAGTIRNEGEFYTLGGTFTNSHNSGVFENNGLFRNDSDNFTILSSIKQLATGTVRNTAGNIYLSGGGEHYPGSVLDAANAPIYLNGGTHTFYGGGFAGNNWTYCSAGIMQIAGDIGPATGAAGGGFGIAGGTVTGNGIISAQRGYFSSGTLGGTVVLRFTDSLTKPANTTLNMNGGTLQSDGLFESPGGADFNLDSASGGGAGTIVNKGTWRTSNAFTYSNGSGGGVFRNEGLFESLAGISMIAAAFHGEAGSTFRSKSGYVRLGGGGIHQPGSTFDADGGDIYLSAGTHQFLGGSFTGSRFVYATGAVVSIEGNVGPSSGAATGGFAIAAGTITGTSMLSAERGILQTGTVGGTVTLRLTGQSSKPSNSTLDMNGGTIRNEGTLTAASGGNINLDSAAGGGAGLIINTGTWRTNDAFTYSNGSGGGVFRNEGLFESLAGVSLIAGAFHSQPGSTFRSKAGYVRLGGGGIHQPGSTLDADGGDIYFSAGTHQLLGGTLIGSRFLYATGGTTSVEGNVGVSSGAATGGFAIAGGTVTGTAMLSAERGSLREGSVGGNVTIRLTGASNKVTNSTLDMNGGTIRNEGTMSQPQSADINLDSSSSAGAGTLVNTGIWNTTGSSNITNGSNAGVIENHGLWHVSAGNSTNYAYFTHHPESIFRVTGGQMIFLGGGNMKPNSTIDTSGGALYLNGGTQTLEGGTITGASTVYCGLGTTLVTGDVGAISGAATGGFGIYNTGHVSGSAMLSVDHGFLASGSMAGTVTLRFTGTSQKITSTVLNMNGGTIRNEGIMNQPASGDFNLDSDVSAGAGTIINTGTWNQTGGSNFTNGSSGGVIDNYSLWHCSAGNSNNYAYFTSHPDSIFRCTAGQMIFMGGSRLKAGATIDTNGGYLYLSTGIHTLEGGTITGNTSVYTNAGTTTVTGDVGNTTGAATGGYGITAGTINGTATLSAERGYLGNGGMGGSVTLRYTGVSTKVSSTVLNMNGGTIRNEGTMNQPASGDFNLDSDVSAGAGTIINTGTWNQTGGSNFTNSSNAGVIDNYSVWHCSAGNSNSYAYFTHHPDSIFRCTAGQMIFLGGSRLKAGATLEANGGYLYFSTGTHTLEGGTITGITNIYTNAGTTTVTGDVGNSTGAATGGYGIIGGTLTGSAMLSAERGYLANGTIGGSVTLRYTGDSTKVTSTVINMNGGTILNEGTMTVAANSDFNLDSASGGGAGTIINSSTWINTGSCNFTNTHLNGTLQNSGTFEVTAGTTQVYSHFTNSGLTRVAAGSLFLRAGSVHTGGLVSNANITFIGSGHSLSGPNAFLGGTGSFSGAVSLTNAARIAPGNSPGSLFITGNVQFLASTEAPAIAIEIDSASQFDHISLGNGAALALGTGVTDLLLELNYQPAPGQTFRIVSAGTGTGSFSGRFRNAPATGNLVSVTYGGNMHQFRVNYDASNKHIDLVYQSGYQLWVSQMGLIGNDGDFDADPDGDGISNGIEFIIGGDPRPGFPDTTPHPNQNNPVLDETHLIFTHRRTHVSRYLPTVVQYNSTLAPAWNDAQQGVNGVIITVDENFYGAGIDKIETKIPRIVAVDGRIFVRLYSEE